jgi:hypothetical protein
VHARIANVGGVLMVEDCGSRNGVLVNGERIAGRTAVRLGDKIAIGDRVLVVSSLDRTRLRTEPRGVAAEQTAVSRETENVRTTYSIFLETVRAALAQGRTAPALAAGGQLCESLEAVREPGAMDRSVIESASTALIALAARGHDPQWLERLLRIRQHLGFLLDARATEEVAQQIEALPAGPDIARRAYVAWAQSQPLRFTDRAALKRLADAKSRAR